MTESIDTGIISVCESTSHHKPSIGLFWFLKHMIRYFKLIARQTLIFCCLFSISGTVIGGDTLILRTAETHPIDYPTSAAINYMGTLVEDWSDGEIAIKLYPGGQLGEEKDTLEITIFGGIDLNRVNMAPLNSIAPETSILGLPFLFRSTAHLRAVLDGPIGEEILAYLEPYGLIGLAYYDSGARSFYNSQRAILAPSDLAGLKIRVQNSALSVAMMEALGANPTTMGFGQVYESLLLGTIDGAENNWPSYESTRHYEAAPYYSITRHTMMPEVLVMSKYRWQKLSLHQQELIRRAAKASVPYMRDNWDKRVNLSRDRVIKAGVKVQDVPDLSLFAGVMEPVYQRFVTSEKMRDLIKRIKAVKEIPIL
ncbi:MAG: TRAP transporter substrate-binding protein [Halieaceae bacterium]|nr:TRAP transporter substrate-binding protein [Halieaceae bacterium]